MIAMSCSSRIEFAPHSHTPAHSRLTCLESTYLPAPGTASFRSTLLSHSCATASRKQATFAFFRDLLNLLRPHFLLIVPLPPIRCFKSIGSSQNGCQLQPGAVARGRDRSSCALYRYVPYDVAYSVA